MCIVVDTCVFNKVFSESNKQHHKYQPVYDWILRGKGTLVYGGSSFLRELGLGKLALIKNLKDKGIAVRISNRKVDPEEMFVDNLIPDSEDFDDPHIIALLRVSGCMLLCTNDKRLDPYIKDRRLFQRRNEQPRIYRDGRNKNLLTDNYITSCCPPNNKIRKSQIDELIKELNN